MVVHDVSAEPRDWLGRWTGRGDDYEATLVQRYLPGVTPAQVRAAFRGEFGKRNLFTKVTSIEEGTHYNDKTRGDEPCLVVGGEIMAGARYVGTFRRFFFDGPSVYHDLVEIEDARLTHTGFGPEFVEHSENSYRQWGIKEVRLRANISLGSYTWAKLGFDFADDAARLEVLNMFAAWAKKRGSSLSETKIRGLKHAWDVAACDDGEKYFVEGYNLAGDKEIEGDYSLGKAFMLAVRPSWPGVRSLDPKSTGQKLFRRYMKTHQKKG